MRSRRIEAKRNYFADLGVHPMPQAKAPEVERDEEAVIRDRDRWARSMTYAAFAQAAQRGRGGRA